jgi:hypothetical protein
VFPTIFGLVAPAVGGYASGKNAGASLKQRASQDREGRYLRAMPGLHDPAAFRSPKNARLALWNFGTLQWFWNASKSVSHREEYHRFIEEFQKMNARLFAGSLRGGTHPKNSNMMLMTVL